MLYLWLDDNDQFWWNKSKIDEISKCRWKHQNSDGSKENTIGHQRLNKNTIDTSLVQYNKNQKISKTVIQVHISGESTKYGLDNEIWFKRMVTQGIRVKSWSGGVDLL